MAIASDPVEWLTPLQAARRAGLSPDRIRDLVDSGRLRGQRTPLGRLIDPADVERLARARGARRRTTEPAPTVSA
jgi:hypothetical protein